MIKIWPARAARTMAITLTAVLLTGSPVRTTTAAAAPTDHVAKAATSPAMVDLPEPPGSFQVGTAPLELVDHTRRDPFAPTSQDRALMVQLWYPAVHADRYPTAPYMPTAAARYEDQASKLPAGTVESIRTHGHLGAPIAPARSSWPIVLFSPGSGMSRSLYTTLVEDIASHGYIVVAIDHPYDADVVEFPDRHLVLRNLTGQDNTQVVQVRAQDISFVLDQLALLNVGRLRPGFRGRLDLKRIAMSGHSLGGASAAAAMLIDRRITAGVDMDGSIYGPVVNQGLDRPFLLMSSARHDCTTDRTWATLWSHLHGWRLDLELTHSGHLSYSDIGVLAGPLHLAGLFPPTSLGTIDGVRAATIEQTYLTAFFNQALHGRSAPVLQRPDPRYPEIIFQTCRSQNPVSP